MAVELACTRRYELDDLAAGGHDIIAESPQVLLKIVRRELATTAVPREHRPART